MNFDSLGARLREARKALAQKQEEIALSCGVSREMWGKYERGAALPGAEVLGALAMRGADIRYILTGERSAPAPLALTAEEQTMLSYFRDAPLAVRKAAVAALLSGVSPDVSRGNVSLNMRGGSGNVQIGGSVKGEGHVNKR